MHAARKTAFAFSILTSLTLAGPAARAQTVTLDGHYDNHSGPQPGGSSFGDGYDTAFGQSYTVVSPATFDGNRNRGLLAGDPTTVNGGEFANNETGLYAASRVTVNDGSFTRNGDGLYADIDSAVTVHGGAFTGNTEDGLRAEFTALAVSGGAFTGNTYDGLATGYGSTVTIDGGAFTGNGHGGLSAGGGTTGTFLPISQGTVAVSGGTFGGNGTDLIAGAGSSLTLYGTGLSFAGLPDTFTLATVASSPDFTGMPVTGPTLFTGTILGTLRNNAAPSSLSFNVNNGGRITLVNVPAVPEPSPAALAVPALGLLGLALRAKRRPLGRGPARGERA